MNTLDELEVELEAIVKALLLPYKKARLLNELSCQFIIEDFGVLICGIHATDYSMVSDFVARNFQGWRKIFVSLTDSLIDKKQEIIWELMRSGYMRYLRINYIRQFKNALITNDLGRQIIQKRLESWGKKPKYKHLIIENEDALKIGVNYLLGVDPSFFDFMPEEDQNV